MVRNLLGHGARLLRVVLSVAAVFALLLTPAYGAKREKGPAPQQAWPELLLPEGRKVTFERTVASEMDVRGKPGFWGKLANVVLGEADKRELLRPYGVAADSRGRIVVTDPGMSGVHVFDPERKKYKFIEGPEFGRDPMLEPQCVAVGGDDRIYVTDSKAGKVFVFEAGGKLRGVFGSAKGEGYFKRPTGIAVDRETGRIYVTDTLADRVFILDGNSGEVISYFGKQGSAPGEFRSPTEVRVGGDTVAVVDAMNFRIQLFDRDGNFRSSIGSGKPGDAVYRPKGIAFDSENHLYVVEAQAGVVRVFDLEGQLLYHFGNGTGFGEFLLPAGLFIDKSDRIYVVDSYNRRIQVLRYHAAQRSAGGQR